MPIAMPKKPKRPVLDPEKEHRANDCPNQDKVGCY